MYYDQKVFHHDIKTDNILIKSDEGEVLIKLCDFGLAKSFDPEGIKNIK